MTKFLYIPMGIYLTDEYRLPLIFENIENSVYKKNKPETYLIDVISIINNCGCGELWGIPEGIEVLYSEFEIIYD